MKILLIIVLALLVVTEYAIFQQHAKRMSSRSGCMRNGKRNAMSRYIDADALIEQLKSSSAYNDYEWAMYADGFIEDIENAPSIDIVRCQDCKYWVYNFNGCSRNPCTEPWYALDFCNYGEREGE